MEYYSAIKKNTFESVLMRWMKLDPIIQSEVRTTFSNMECLRVLSKNPQVPEDCLQYYTIFLMHRKKSTKHCIVGVNMCMCVIEQCLKRAVEIKSIKLEMKMERSQQTTQKYKGS